MGVRVPQKSVWVAGLKDRSTMRQSLNYKCHPRVTIRLHPVYNLLLVRGRLLRRRGSWRSWAGAGWVKATTSDQEGQGGNEVHIV